MSCEPRTLRLVKLQSAIISIIWLLVGLARAEIEVTVPVAGTTYSPSVFTITWADDGTSPSLSELSTVTIMLCTGLDSAMNCFATLYSSVPLSSFTGNTLTTAITPSVGADGVYFLQFTADVTAGGYIINYSDRFILTGMTGTLAPTYGGSYSGPAGDNHASNVESATSSYSNVFTVPYYLQDGWLTNYAPMQNQPPSKVSLKTASPLFPTSKISSYFKTNTMKPVALTTTTMPRTYSVTSVVNDAVTQPLPIDNGGYYSVKTSSTASATAAAKKKRWDD
ncbi:hypothetical protein V1511DRAFT_500792 [Dipodascopsis uninucleata]